MMSLNIALDNDEVILFAKERRKFVHLLFVQEEKCFMIIILDYWQLMADITCAIMFSICIYTSP